MAPTPGRTSVTAQQPTPATEEHSREIGPHPGYVSVASQYTFEQPLRRTMKDLGCDPSREDSYRLHGVQLIDNVREHLQLPVRTFDTACTYYHKFRLCFRDAEYNYQDAALASLFVACKVEDTIKKSREILCAAYNLKTPDHPTTQDDKMFDQPSKLITGLERHILETIGFDFRVRYPQKLLAKAVKSILTESEAREFYPIAYAMSVDVYKTFAPIKQSTFTMVMAVLELTSLITSTCVDKMAAARDGSWQQTDRAPVVETMLDLLDLYTLFPRQTKIAPRFDRDKLIEIKIGINREVDSQGALSRFEDWCDRCEAEDRDVHPITPASATSPATTTSLPGSGGGVVKRGGVSARGGGGQGESTIRFVFDADEARREEDAVATFYRTEYEEVEEELEVPVQEHGSDGGNGSNHGGDRRPSAGRDRDHRHSYDSKSGGGGSWSGAHHNGNHDSSHRSRNHHDRHKGRKGGRYY